MDLKKIARDILNVGNEETSRCNHYHTRLRFSLMDSDKVNKDNLSKIEGVITVVESMDQLQVIIGINVDKVYKELEKMLLETTDISNNEVLKMKKQEIHLTSTNYYGTNIYTDNICTSWFCMIKGI